MSPRICAALACLLTTAVSAYAQAPPRIDNIYAYYPGSDYPGTEGVTAGLAQQGIELRIVGANFPVGAAGVTWTAQSGQTNLSVLPETGGPTEVRVYVPPQLVAAPEVVQIRVANSPPASFRVNPPMQVRALAPASVGIAYSSPLFTGGTPPFWQESSIPAPFTLNAATGAMEGTPTAPGNIQFDGYFGDNWGSFASGTYNLSIAQPVAVSSPATLPDALFGAFYSQTFGATGGIGPYTFAIVNLASGGLSLVPTGISLSPAGTLTGAPGAAGSFLMNIRVTDAEGRTSNRQYTLVVLPPPLSILTASLPPGTEGAPYAAQLAATGGISQYSWALASGTLPAGLVLSAAGRISGTPTQTGTAQFTVRVADLAGQTASRALSIQILRNVQTLEIPTTTLPEAILQTPYSTAIIAAGGEPPYTWTITGLPAGLTPQSDGSITGRATELGVFRVAVSVTDAGRRLASTYLSLVVRAQPLVITTTSPLPDARVGASMSQAFAATGGVPPYRWGIASGAIPPGTSFVGGLLSGSPEAAGGFEFAVSVTDSRGVAAAKGFSLAVNAPLTITTSSLPAGRARQPYAASLGASGGQPPYTWNIGGLAEGLSGSAAGVIGGTPDAAGTSTVTAEVSDARGNRATASFELSIAGPALRITTASPLPDATAGQAYSAGFTAEGGTPPYRWSAVAGYAGGLSLSTVGVLSGTPGDPGEYTVHVQVADSARETATGGFSFRVGAPALAIATASLPNGTVGAPYSAGLSATGNSGAVNWSVSGLPDGLSADAGGAISGTPRAPGSFQVAVRAADAAGRSATRTLALAIGLPSVPGINFGMPPTADPARQPAVQLGLEGVYPLPITGRLILTFSADSGGDDPTVVFSNGSRSVDFTIPAGANLATFAIPNAALQTGTVAGTITLSVALQASGSDITPSPAPSRIIRINRMAPVITRLAITRTAAGFDVNVTGYSTTREVAQAIFRFNPAAGATLQTSETTMAVDAVFSRWYNDAASRGFGSQFTFTQTFNIQGQAADVASVTVILVNAAGRSEAATASF